MRKLFNILAAVFSTLASAVVVALCIALIVAFTVFGVVFWWIAVIGVVAFAVGAGVYEELKRK